MKLEMTHGRVGEELEFYVKGYRCALDTIDNFNSFVYDSYYYLITQSDPSLPGAWLTAGKKCFDCTKRGGVNDIPDFW